MMSSTWEAPPASHFHNSVPAPASPPAAKKSVPLTSSSQGLPAAGSNPLAEPGAMSATRAGAAASLLHRHNSLPEFWNLVVSVAAKYSRPPETVRLLGEELSGRRSG